MGVTRPKQRVLVVDDDADIRQILVHHLTSYGVEAIAVGDGAAALEWLQKETPDLVCLDLALPVVSGFKVCRAIREHESSRDVPILVLTGRDSLEAEARAAAERRPVFDEELT
jgi:DNA-binding response OmpR family regulator